MCIIFIVITGFLSVSFFSSGDMLFALLSGLVCTVLLGFFIRNLVTNSACLFGKKTDCGKKK